MTDLASLAIEITTGGAAKAKADLEGVAAAGAKAEASAGTLTASQKLLAEAMRASQPITARMIQDVGGYAAAEKIMAGAVKEAQAAVTAGAAAAKAAGGLQVAAAEAVVAAHGKMTGSSLKVRESLVLLREAARGDFTRMAGSASILANAFGVLPAIISPVGIGIIAVTATMAGLAFAMLKGEQEASKFSGSLIATGNYAGLTSSMLEDMAHKISAASDTTITSTKKSIEALAESGRFSGAAIASLADAAANYSRITHESADKYIKEYEGMKDHLVQFAVKHEDVYHDLTLQQVEQIDWLVKHGQEERAQELLSADIDAASRKRKDEALQKDVANYGTLQRTLHEVMLAASSMWDALLGLGRPKTLDQQIIDQAAKVQDVADKLNNPNGYGGRGSLSAQGTRDALVAKMNQALGEMHNLQARQKAENDKAASDAKAAAANHNAIQARFGDGKPRASTKILPVFADDLADINAQAAAAQQSIKLGQEEKQVQAEINKFKKAGLSLSEAQIDAYRKAVVALKAADAQGSYLDAAQKAHDAEVERIKGINAQLGLTAYQQARVAEQYKIIGAEAKAQLTPEQARLDLAKQLADYDAGRAATAGKTADTETQAIARLNDQMALSLEARLHDIAVRDLANQGIQAGVVGYEQLLAAADNANHATVNAAVAEKFAFQMGLARDHIQDIADLLNNGFGKAGAAFGQIALAAADYNDVVAQSAKATADLQDQLAQAVKNNDTVSAGKLQIQLTEQQTRAIQDNAAAEVRRNVQSLDSFKQLFSTKSGAYKVLNGLEIAYQTLQIAGSVKAIAIDAIHTAKSIGHALARGAADAAAGAAKMFAYLGPFAFPVVAAMVAVLVGLGLKLTGGGGGATVPTAADLQAAQGAGSVLGDSTAKSDSIAKSLTLIEAHTNKDLEFFNPMLKALRSIDNNIGLVASSLAKQLGAGGAFDTSKLGIGTTSSGPGTLTKILSPLSLLLPGLFGSKTTTTLLDQGLSFNPQSLQDVLAGGINGQSYQDVATQTKKKFFGITYSNNTKNSEIAAPLDAELATQIGKLIGSLRDSVVAAATTLGVDGAEATLNAYQIQLGKISLKDLKPAEVEAALNAVFSKLGDDLASSVVPALKEFQKAGEGLFETLSRVARDYQVVDVALQSIGKTFGQVGLSSIGAREHLVELFGSLDNFTTQTQFFADNFLTDIERMAPIQAAVEKELTRLGLSGVTTKDAFKQLVLSLDVSTAAGSAMYAALLNLAPAFQKVVDFTVTGSQDLTKAKDDLSKAYQTEAAALQATADKFANFADSLKKFRASLDTGPSALLSPEAQYNATKAAFLDTAAKARLGDETALSDLQSVSQAYLDASKSYYASSGPYFKDLADVKAAVQAAAGTASRTADNATRQLTELKASVAGLIDINNSVLSVRDAILALQTAMGAAAGATGTGLPTFLGGSGTGGIEGLTATPAPAPDASAASATAAAGTPNWDSYLKHYPDVAQEAQRVTADGEFPSATAYAQWHYDHYGQAEGRVPFATGGSFTVGGYGGPDSQAFGPIKLSPGEVVDVRRPGANDNGEVVAELRALRAQNRDLNARLERVLAQHGEATVEAQTRAGQRIVTAVGAGPTTARLKSGGAL